MTYSYCTCSCFQDNINRTCTRTRTRKKPRRNFCWQRGNPLHFLDNLDSHVHVHVPRSRTCTGKNILHWKSQLRHNLRHFCIHIISFRLSIFWGNVYRSLSNFMSLLNSGATCVLDRNVPRMNSSCRVSQRISESVSRYNDYVIIVNNSQRSESESIKEG